jgi:N-acetylmuramoyl-L-alanine amidase
MKKFIGKKAFQMTFIYVIMFLFLMSALGALPVNKKVIVIDPGHGEWDPGKQNRSVNEKDINLAISDKLQQLFELGGAVVLTTRSTDDSLADRKRADLTASAALANAASADVFISIHQNSFDSPSVHGAQVFYHATGTNSKVLAELIQERLNTFVGKHGGSAMTRPAKESESYFVLKKTTMPAVIVECGFMSNLRDLELLQNEDFQEKVCWAIYMGVMDYFDKLAAGEVGPSTEQTEY